VPGRVWPLPGLSAAAVLPLVADAGAARWGLVLAFSDSEAVTPGQAGGPAAGPNTCVPSPPGIPWLIPESGSIRGGLSGLQSSDGSAGSDR